MGRNVFIRICIVLLLLVAPQAPAAPPCVDAECDAGAAPRLLFWQADAPGATLYLLGSIHFGRPDLYPLPAAVTAAYAASDALVVEVDLSALDAAEVARRIAAQALYPDGSTLEEALPPALWQRLTAAASRLEMPPALLARHKPWFASLGLSALALRRYGYGEEWGIEQHFFAAGAKPVIELESLAEQLDMLDGLPAAEQILMLEATLRDIEQGPALLEEIVEAWRRGEADKLDALMNDQLGADAAGRRLHQALLLDRNETMVRKLTALLEDGGRYFVVVGAAHLVGEQGLVELLRARGYRVDRR